ARRATSAPGACATPGNLRFVARHCAHACGRIGRVAPEFQPEQPMSYQNIVVETKGKVGIIRLNRPQALNALNAALMSELGAAVAAYEADPAIACMVVTGSEKAFAAGADIKEMSGKSYQDALLTDFPGGWHQLAHARKPVIAAVAGFALGGGCELAMQCDMIIAADTAKFGQPEIKLGVI